MGRFIPSVAGTLVVFVVGCSGSDSAQSQPQSKDAGADSSADGSTGGSGGNGNTGGTGGTSGSGGIGGGGASGGIGGASGSAGASGGGGASGSAGASGGGGASGSAGASGGGGASGSSGAGGSAGAAGASGSDAGVDAGNDAQASCSLGQACCSGSTCTGGYNCLGQTCSCILAIHGNTVLRTNGTVVSYGGPATVIEQGSTGQPLSGITEIYEGSHYGCGLKNDHTVWCWPKNTNANAAGELGNGTQTAPQNADLFKATQVLVAAGTPLSGVDHISKGSARCYLASNTCGVKSDGTLWCWGSHDSSGGGGGSLFNGGISGPQSFAKQIMKDATNPLTGVEAVSLGSRHACVLKDGGQVWCWGSGIGGAQGQNNQDEQPYPKQVTLPGAASLVGAGADATCALVSGSVYCWGASGSGQVGAGTPVLGTGCINYCQLTPTQVIDGTSTPITGVKDLSMDYLAACATMSNDDLYCWGAGAGNVAAPLSVTGNPVTNVALHTACSSSGINSALRYLTRDDVLKNPANTVNQICP